MKTGAPKTSPALSKRTSSQTASNSSTSKAQKATPSSTKAEDPASLATQGDAFGAKAAPATPSDFVTNQSAPQKAGTPVGLAMVAAKSDGVAKLPDWFPGDWDIDVAAQTAKNLLVQQGEDPARIKRGLVDHVVFTDADHTLVNTSTPVLLRDAATGHLVHHPKTGEIVALPSRGYQDAFEELKQEFPKRDWSAVGFDYSGMADATELHRHDHIESTAEVLRDNEASGRGRQFIITARSSDNIPAAFLDYTSQRDIRLSGTFPVNGQRYTDAFDFTRHNLDTAEKKAMTMAALMHLYAPKNGTLETVRFYEDSDPNLRAAMQLLPKLFPKTNFEFWDVVHNDEGGFDSHLIATNDGPTVVDKDGKRLSEAEIAAYESADAPMPDHVGPIRFPTNIPENQG